MLFLSTTPTHSECTSTIYTIRSYGRSTSIFKMHPSSVFNRDPHWLEVEILASVTTEDESGFRRGHLHYSRRRLHLYEDSNVEIYRNRYQRSNELSMSIGSTLNATEQNSERHFVAEFPSERGGSIFCMTCLGCVSTQN